MHYQTWSLDGNWIYFSGGNMGNQKMDLWRIAASGGQPERLTFHDAPQTGFPTPIDSRTLLYIAEDRDGSGPWLWSLDLDTRASRRVAYGIEQYHSIDASADHRRLVASVANPGANLWVVPIQDIPATERDVQASEVPTVRALAPRFGGKAMFYLSSQGTGDGLWRFEDGNVQEVWKGSDESLPAPAAVSADGKQIVLALRRSGKRRLYVASSAGTGMKVLTEDVEVDGSACWSPDSKSIVAGGSDAKGPGLFKVPVEGGTPVRLVSGNAQNPVWSPDGALIVYNGGIVSAYAPLAAIRPDGSPVNLPTIRIQQQGERFRFLPNGKGLVYMQGDTPAQDFWLLDLVTMKSRQLTKFTGADRMRTFDVAPDGKSIVFDRLRENSNLVLIDLPVPSR
jgi:Tol biopolymer transport system component